MKKVKLSSICNIASGGTPARSNSAYWKNGTIPWVKIGDITDKFLSQTSEHITQEGLNSSSAKLFPKGTILYTIFATLGEVAILNIAATTNQAIAGICLNDSRFTIQYLYYYLTSLKDYVNNIGRGVAQNNINLSILKNFEITLRTLPEQEHIVESLTRVEQVIALRRAQLAKLDELVKCRFVEMFGDISASTPQWCISQIRDLVTVEPQNGLYKAQSFYVKQGATPILRIDAFYNGKVTDFTHLKRLKCTQEEIKKFLLKENDIVINRVNSIEYLGKCALIQGLLEDTVFESNMMRFHFDENLIDPVYATFLLSSRYTYVQILSKAKKAVNQASINQKDVLSINIPVPPLHMQQQFSSFVQRIDKLRFSIQSSLEKTQQLFDSLMQEYFD